MATCTIEQVEQGVQDLAWIEAENCKKVESLDCVLGTDPYPYSFSYSDLISSWQIDSLLVRLIELRKKLDRPLASLAAAFGDAKAWRAMGCTRQDDYMRLYHERSPRWMRDQIALGRALRRFPALEAAFEGRDGERPLGRLATITVYRVATDTTIDVWIDRARSVSFLQLQADARAYRAAQEKERAEQEQDEHRSVFGRENVEAFFEALDELRALRKENGAPGGEAQAEDESSRSEFEDVELDFFSTVVIDCPREVLAAFDEVLDLHSAVNGREESATSLIEALTAENSAGFEYPDAVRIAALKEARYDWALRYREETGCRPDPYVWIDEIPRDVRAENAAFCGVVSTECEPRYYIEEVEALFGEYDRLEETAEFAVASMKQALSEDEQICAEALHRAMVDLIAFDGRIERVIARLLGALQRIKPWGRAGVPEISNGSPHHAPTWARDLGQYAQERLGITASRANKLARVARRLMWFPVLEKDWRAGKLSTDMALELMPLLALNEAPAVFGLDEEMQKTWSDHAQKVTIRRLRDEVRAVRRGVVLGEPVSGPPAEPIKEVDPEVTVPRPLSDEQWVESLLRTPGRTLRHLEHVARRLEELAERTTWSHRNRLSFTLPDSIGHPFLVAIDHARGVDLMASCEAEPTFAADETAQETHASEGESPYLRAKPRWWGLLQLMIEYAHTWDPPEDISPGGGGLLNRRAAQDTYERYGYRCAAPGCTSRANLEEHHINHRAGGGTDDPSNRICLCRFHHQAHHETPVFHVSGKAPTDVIYRFGPKDSPSALTFRCDVRLSSRD